MNRELFESEYLKNLNKNFQSRSKYFDFRFDEFSELRTLIFEINNCLILEFHRASITLTNYLLERLLKLALIKKEIGVGTRPPDKWTEIYAKPNDKYTSLNLSNSIEQCKKFNLITANERDFLFTKIRELIRNGFSHADSTKILKGASTNVRMYQGSFSNPKEVKKIIVNPTKVPFLQETLISDFARSKAELYFNYVFDLTRKINSRLLNEKKEG